MKLARWALREEHDCGDSNDSDDSDGSEGPSMHQLPALLDRRLESIRRRVGEHREHREYDAGSRVRRGPLIAKMDKKTVYGGLMKVGYNMTNMTEGETCLHSSATVYPCIHK